MEKSTSITNDNTAYMQLKSKYNKISDRCTEIHALMQSNKNKKSYLEGQIRELHNHIEDRSKK